MKKAILYCRVSSSEQKREGTSLSLQEERLTGFCQRREIEIAGIFLEDHSAKTFSRRPQWRRIEELVRADKSIDGILVTRWDRFSRYDTEALVKVDYYKEKGVEINAIEQWHDFKVPEARIGLLISLGIAHSSNVIHSQRVKDGMRHAAKEGRHVYHAPLGYTKIRTTSRKSHLAPDGNAEVVQYIFRELATGKYQPDEMRKMVRRERGLKMTKNGFRKLLTNKLYIGLVRVKATEDEPEKTIEGVHEPLVPRETFYQVQSLLAGRKRGTYVTKTGDHFPLKPHLLCPVCQRNITASSSKGNGGRYGYYHCQSSHYRVRAPQAEADFEHYLRTVKPGHDMVDAFKAFLNEKVVERRTAVVESGSQIEKKMSKLNAELARMGQLLIDGVLPRDQYRLLYDEKSNELEKLRAQLIRGSDVGLENWQVVDKGMELLVNLDQLYQKADPANKCLLVGSIFPEKLFYEDGKYRTHGNNEIISIFRGNFQVVDTGGFEPPTPTMST